MKIVLSKHQINPVRIFLVEVRMFFSLSFLIEGMA